MKYQASRETVRLELGDELWIEVKKELDYGELRRLRSAIFTIGADGQQTLKVNAEDSDTLFIVIALVDWSLKDDNGVKLPITPKVIDSLSQDSCVMPILEALKNFYVQDDGKKKEI